jgi:hypothetical protein
MRISGRVASDEPAALAARVARHFAHKVPVEERGAARRIETRFGRIDLEPDGDDLRIALEGGELDELRTVALSHLERFARGAPFDVRWD